MANKLHFSLVSPERELFSGDVDQVDLPGAEGDFGVFPDHSPFMAAIRTGAITVFDAGKQVQFLIQGGFADVTADGLTVLAERAMPLSDVTRDAISAEIDAAQKALGELSGDAAFTTQQNIDGLRAVLDSL